MSALIRVVSSASSVVLLPGERVEVTVTIQNLAEIVDRYGIAVEGIDPSWVSLSRPELALFPKDTDQVRLTLKAPAGSVARAGRHDLRVVVTSQENPAERTTVPLELDVAALPTLELRLHPRRQSGMAEGLFVLHVANHGNTDLTVEFEATDPEEALDYGFEARRLLLAPGEERQVQLRIRLREAMLGRGARVYPFSVSACPREAPQQVQSVQGEWELAVPALELSLRPQKGRGVRQGDFQLVVRNPGSTPLPMVFEASDPEDACQYLFQPAEVTVPPGQEVRVQLTVRPRAALTGEQSRTFGFTVDAAVTGGAPQTRQVHGEWEHLPPAFELSLRSLVGRGTGEGSFRVGLSNPEESDLMVRVEAADAAGACVFSLYVPESLPVVVRAGQELVLALLVRPRVPRATAVPRPHPFTVTARTAVGTLRGDYQVHGEWVQLPPAGAPGAPVAPAAAHGPGMPLPRPPVPGQPAGAPPERPLTISVHPPRSSGVGDGFFRVVLSNRGRTDMALLVQASDPQAACQFSLYAIGAFEVLVPGGREVGFPLLMRPKAPVAGTAALTHSFTVTAALTTPPKVVRQAHGTWVQLPLPAPSPAQPVGPPGGQPVVPGRRDHAGSAVAALVVALLALLLGGLLIGFVPQPALILALLLGLVSLVLGFVGLASARRGMAIAAIVVGGLVCVLAIFLLVMSL